MVTENSLTGNQNEVYSKQILISVMQKYMIIWGQQPTHCIHFWHLYLSKTAFNQSPNLIKPV